MNKNLNNNIEIEIKEFPKKVSIENTKQIGKRSSPSLNIKDDEKKNDDNDLELLYVPADKLYHTILKLKKNKLYYNLAIYMFFLFLFCMINFQMIDIHKSFEQNDVLKELLVWEEFPYSLDSSVNILSGPMIEKNAYDVKTHEELIEWLEGPFFDNVYSDEYYNESPKNNTFLLGGFNKIINRIQIRQNRVKLKQCPSFIENEKYHCSFEYSGQNEDKEKWQIGNRTYNFYNNMSNMYGISGFGYDYGNGGYQIILPLDKIKAIKKINELKDNLWIDYRTRTISINLNIYNPNTNLINVVRILFELTENGRIDLLLRFYTMPYTIYKTLLGRFMFAGQVFYMLFILYYIWEEIVDIKLANNICQYLIDFWNIIDIINLVMHILTIVAYINWLQDFEVIDDQKILLQSEKYIDLFDLAQKYYTIAVFSAFNAFIGFLKIFKYLQLSHRLNVLWVTLKKAFWDISSMFIVFMLIILGFATTGHLIYGTNMREYHSLISSISTVLRLSIGEINYSELLKVNSYFTPVFITSYIFMVVFVMMNMFIAVISEYFIRVKLNENEMKNKQKKNYILSFLRKLEYNGNKYIINKINKKIVDNHEEHINVITTIVRSSQEKIKKEILLDHRKISQLKIENILNRIDKFIYSEFRTNIYYHFMKYWKTVEKENDIQLNHRDLVKIFISKELCSELINECHNHDSICKQLYPEPLTENDILQEILEIVTKIQNK
jgi:polycystin 2